MSRRRRVLAGPVSLATLLGCFLLVAIWVAKPIVAEPPAAKNVQAVVVTVDDQQISAPIASLSDERLTLEDEPQRSFALADLQRIEFGKPAAGADDSDLRWIGQDNHDLAQVGGATGGNGVQDLHLKIVHLKNVPLTQITVLCRIKHEKGTRLHAWRLDTTKSPHWRLAVERNGLAPEAELYLEPPSEDCYDQTFEATLNYGDASSTKASVKAKTHTSDQLKVDSAAKPGGVVSKAAPSPASKAIVYLGPLSGAAGLLHGDVKEMNAESLTLHTDWHDVPIPLLQVQGIWFGKGAARADFDKQMNDPAAEDLVFLLAPDKSPAQVAGSVQSLADGKLTLRYQGADRAVNLDRLLGVVFAAHPKIPPLATLHQAFHFANADMVLGRMVALHDRELEIETPWQSRVKIPVAALVEVRMRNGRLTFLGDLEPAAVEEVAYFGRVMHWRRDQGFDDAPPRIRGKQPSRSLAMHSRSVLTYALDGQYEKFKARVGFDDSAGDRGRVACRVLVDGREQFAEKDLRSTQDPRDVEVNVSGARQLVLEVDFGEGEDVGDRVIWAEPRLFRSEAK